MITLFILIVKWYLIVSFICAILCGLMIWYDSIVYKDWLEAESKFDDDR